MAGAAGELPQVLARGTHLLREDLPDDLARIAVATAVSAAAALTGEAGLLDEAAAVGGLTADRVPTVIPGFGLADFQVLGHRLAGTPDRASAHARKMRAASADLPGPARLMGLVVAGHAALAGGRVRDALLPLREAWSVLAESGHEFRFRCRPLLATALAQSGQPAEAAPLLAGIVASRHPAYRLYLPDDLLARAWGPPPRAGRPRLSATPSPQPSSPATRGPRPTRCSPGRPPSSSATRPWRCRASPNSPSWALGPRRPAAMPGPWPTGAARHCSRPPTSGPGSATSRARAPEPRSAAGVTPPPSPARAGPALPLPQRLVRAVGESPLSERMARAQEIVYGFLTEWARRGPLHTDALGHSVHPLLTDLTLGCWMSASILDLGGGPQARRAATILVGAGLAASGPTAIAGACDWAQLSGAECRIGAVHALGTDIATFLLLGSFLARIRGRYAAGRGLGLAGNVAAAGAGFLGGHLALNRGTARRGTGHHRIGREEFAPVAPPASTG